MTKAEKYQKAKTDHDYAMTLIKELEDQLTIMRVKLQWRNRTIRKLEGKEKPTFAKSNYDAMRAEWG